MYIVKCEAFYVDQKAAGFKSMDRDNQVNKLRDIISKHVLCNGSSTLRDIEDLLWSLVDLREARTDNLRRAVMIRESLSANGYEVTNWCHEHQCFHDPLNTPEGMTVGCVHCYRFESIQTYTDEDKLARQIDRAVEVGDYETAERLTRRLNELQHMEAQNDPRGDEEHIFEEHEEEIPDCSPAGEPEAGWAFRDK